MIEAHRQVVRPPLSDPGIAEAVGRQTAAMRELSRRAFPELDIKQARTQRRRQAAATEVATLRRPVRKRPAAMSGRNA